MTPRLSGVGFVRMDAEGVPEAYGILAKQLGLWVRQCATASSLYDLLAYVVFRGLICIHTRRVHPFGAGLPQRTRSFLEPRNLWSLCSELIVRELTTGILVR